MRALLALVLVAAAMPAAAQRYPDRACEALGRRSSRGGVACDSLAFFEFAPDLGRGPAQRRQPVQPVVLGGDCLGLVPEWRWDEGGGSS